MACSKANQNGATTLVLIMILAVVLETQTLITYAYTAARARLQSQMRQSLELMSALEDLAVYVRAGYDQYYTTGNGSCVAGTTATNFTSISGAAYQLCLAPLPSSGPGASNGKPCLGIIHNGVPYCLNSAGSALQFAVNQNMQKSERGKSSMIFFQAVASEMTPASRPRFLAPLKDRIIDKLASLSELEVKTVSKLLRSQGIFENSSWALSGQTGSAQLAAFAGARVSSAITAPPPSSTSPIASTMITTETCNSNTCGQVGICPPWKGGNCPTVADQVTLTFKLLL